ncbi:hypothetical protein HK099_001842 [Clydaea vesicula]|uniref:Uncharacterized protein n=1 Tax=Clydaea vesicula TaxID=447962 RepID=A0AAD5U350_9FUNG|nr:hypothetical protein HK099_001842 [Clydaea vesicula]KAJ3397330.1 hypothetical protein HDU92_008874 [Lobulomyces angularis]
MQFFLSLIQILPLIPVAFGWTLFHLNQANSCSSNMVSYAHYATLFFTFQIPFIVTRLFAGYQYRGVCGNVLDTFFQSLFYVYGILLLDEGNCVGSNLFNFTLLTVCVSGLLIVGNVLEGFRNRENYAVVYHSAKGGYVAIP